MRSRIVGGSEWKLEIRNRNDLSFTFHYPSSIIHNLTMVSHQTKIMADCAEAPKTVSILGSTGTIGCNTVRLIEEQPEKFIIESLTARNNYNELINQAKRLSPKFVAIENEELYGEVRDALAGSNIEVAAGSNSIVEAASRSADMVIAGIVGAASLLPTMAAIRSGSDIGLANKECLVCAGELMIEEAHKHNAAIIPVDSEHNSIFQSLDSNNSAIEKITLTASGGPFRTYSAEQMHDITPEQAVEHPNWTMGAKISVDSATMMNKGLEVIEAYHLFPVDKQQIDVLVHPESVVHGLVYYADGAVVAGMSVPDMCVPLAYALGWPERIRTNTQRLNLAEIGSLTFETPDEQRFPALALAREVLQEGGTAPAILNAANEIAVESFIQKKIGFLDIVNVVRQALEELPATPVKSLDDVIEADGQARSVAKKNTGKTV